MHHYPNRDDKVVEPISVWHRWWRRLSKQTSELKVRTKTTREVVSSHRVQWTVRRSVGKVAGNQQEDWSSRSEVRGRFL